MPQSIKKQLETALDELKKAQEHHAKALNLIYEAQIELNYYRRSRIGLMPELSELKEPED